MSRDRRGSEGSTIRDYGLESQDIVENIADSLVSKDPEEIDFHLRRAEAAHEAREQEHEAVREAHRQSQKEKRPGPWTDPTTKVKRG